jgi:hypothetical protein
VADDRTLVCAGCGKSFSQGELVVIDNLPYHSEACWRETDARWKPHVAVLLVGLLVAVLILVVVLFLSRAHDAWFWSG